MLLSDKVKEDLKNDLIAWLRSSQGVEERDINVESNQEEIVQHINMHYDWVDGALDAKELTFMDKFGLIHGK